MQLRLRQRGALTNDAKRRYGLLMHDILSAIVVRDDVPKAVAQMLAGGEIEPAETDTLTHSLLQHIDNDGAIHWFDGSMPVMNEAEILFGHGQTRRPDRIMFDNNNNRVIVAEYKFGDVKEEAYHLQTEKYRSLLNEMGFLNVECFLWYITLGEIEKCIF